MLAKVATRRAERNFIVDFDEELRMENSRGGGIATYFMACE